MGNDVVQLIGNSIPLYLHGRRRFSSEPIDVGNKPAFPCATSPEAPADQFLAQGLSNAEIAQALYLSEATVKSNLSHIMSKWGVRDRVQVLIHAVRTNLVTL